MTKTLAEMSYKRKDAVKGYTDKTLHIDLSKLSIEENDVDKKVREVFIGGKGYYVLQVVHLVVQQDIQEQENR